MKPIEAARTLSAVRTLLVQGQPLPPTTRMWLAHAIDTRLASPARSLDQLLGLASRKGGRLHACSKLPERDEVIRFLAAQTCEVKPARQAQALGARVRNHHSIPEPELSRIEAKFGRLPETRRRIQGIISTKPRADGNLKPVDLSNVWNPRHCQNEPKTTFANPH